MPALTTNLLFTASVQDSALISTNATVKEIAMEQRPLENVIFICDRNSYVFVKSVRHEDFSTVDYFKPRDSNSSESIFLSPRQQQLGVNYYYIDVLESLRLLKDGWDEDDAKAPSADTIDAAISFVKYLQSVGERVYHIAPGPVGEIMVELRSGNNSIEFLFYPHKVKYVLFGMEKPVQGEFQKSMLPNLLASVHA